LKVNSIVLLKVNSLISNGTYKNTKTSATQRPLILFENLSKKTSISGIMNQKAINRFRMKRQKATMILFFFMKSKTKKPASIKKCSYSSPTTVQFSMVLQNWYVPLIIYRG
jgi:hypothetical protein